MTGEQPGHLREHLVPWERKEWRVGVSGKQGLRVPSGLPLARRPPGSISAPTQGSGPGGPLHREARE